MPFVVVFGKQKMSCVQSHHHNGNTNVGGSYSLISFKSQNNNYGNKSC